MFYADLSAYSYIHDCTQALPQQDADPNNAPTVVNVGWLEPPHSFPTGAVSEAFMDGLFARCESRINQMRGFHVCSFCEDVPSTELYLRDKGITIRVPNHMQATRNGRTLGLGSAEIRVRGQDGTVYAAPNLMYHYVAVHGYLPPAAFIEAVLWIHHKRIEPL